MSYLGDIRFHQLLITATLYNNLFAILILLFYFPIHSIKIQRKGIGFDFKRLPGPQDLVQ